MKLVCGWLGACEPGLARERLERMAERLAPGASPRLSIGASGAIAALGAPLEPPGGAGTAERISSRLTRPGAPEVLAEIDESTRELVLAVDPFGIGTLYFSRTSAGAIFASRLSSLLEHPEVRSEVDPQSVFNYVFFHVVPGPRSIFRGIERLEPGELVRVRDGELRRERYWRPRYEVDDAKTERELALEFRDRVRGAVRANLESSAGEVGAFLSGGTDSSTLVGVLGEITGAPPRAYSIGFQIEGYDESRYARIAAAHFGAEHHEYVVTPEDFERVLPRLAEGYDEPFGNSSAVASYFCARLARENGVTTLLGGDGGDEIFAGNERYATQALFEYYFRLPRPLRGVLEPLLGPPRESAFALLRKARSYVQQANTPLPDRLERYNFVERMGPAKIFTPEFLRQVSIEEPLELLRKSYAEPETSAVVNRLLYLDLKFTLADNDLRKVGTTCEMAGVEARFPFLDPELVDFANRLPPELKLKGRRLRYFFKRASEGFLPEAILKKKKHGFGVPAGRWMRDRPPLRETAHQSLRALAGRGYLRDDFVRELVALHDGEHVDYYGVMVYVLSMLELWHRARGR